MAFEVLLLAAGIALGATPLLARLRQRAARRAAIAGALAVSGLCSWAAVSTRMLPVEERHVEHRPKAVEDDGYTSSDACRSCHPDQYASWHASWHRTMTQVARPESVVGDFGESGITLSAFGSSERLWREGDEFWVERDNPLWRPMSGEERRIQRRIVLTTGSHNMQFYWYATGHSREVGLVSFVYLIELDRWIPYAAEGMAPPPAHGAELAPPPGSWNRGCVHCHTTRAKMKIRPNPVRPANPLEPARSLLETEVTEFGISCEACHGPGEQHALRYRDPLKRYGQLLGTEDDASIVNPSRLSARRSSQVCGQCHGVVLAFNPSQRSRALPSLSEHGFRFRPGDELSETRTIVDPTKPSESELSLLLASQPHFLEERFWSDGVIRVTGRELNALMASPCFRDGESERDLSCLSCHDLHQSADDPRDPKEWANDMLAPEMQGNEACLQCHEQLRPQLQAHTHHAADSSGSQCYNCHMSYTSYGLLKAIRSHTIDSPDVADSLATGRPNACNQCHLDQTLGWTARRLAGWYGTPELDLYERSVPAGVLWLLKGDAGQRGLMAWSMGWDAAREASGEKWMGEFLSVLLEDPYANVRLIAHRSLQSLPGFRDFPYDPLAEPTERSRARERALSLWRTARVDAGEPADGLHLLDDPEGSLSSDVFQTLLSRRDDRRVVLKE
jgi:hypothetical protein